MKFIHPKDGLWAGDEASYEAACNLADEILATSASEMQARIDGSQEVPSMLDKQGRVGVINISGSLYASAPLWAKLVYGVRDYGDIAQALVQAAHNADIGSVLLNINSPGGAVSGVSAVAQLVRDVGRIKPTVSYTSGQMASAAYWIGSASKHVLAGDLAEVGSIGVIQMHAEVTKQLEKEGTTVTVLRAGKYKALMNPYEPLSEQARADAQAKLDFVYDKFVADVATNRNVSEKAASKMAEGRVFLGQAAADIGLVDQVATTNEALTKAEELASQFLDNRKSLIQNTKKQEGSGNMKKATLTEQEIAALASGVTAPAIEASAESVALEAKAEAETKDEALVEGALEPVADSSALVLLKEQASATQAEIVTLKVELAQVKAQAEATTGAVTSLSTIARASVTNMCVALGKSHDYVAALDGAALVEEHTKISAQFTERFKVGGVSASSTDSASAKGQSQVDSRTRAGIAATRLA